MAGINNINGFKNTLDTLKNLNLNTQEQVRDIKEELSETQLLFSDEAPNFSRALNILATSNETHKISGALKMIKNVLYNSYKKEVIEEYNLLNNTNATTAALIYIGKKDEKINYDNINTIIEKIEEIKKLFSNNSEDKGLREKSLRSIIPLIKAVLAKKPNEFNKLIEKFNKKIKTFKKAKNNILAHTKENKRNIEIENKITKRIQEILNNNVYGEKTFDNLKSLLEEVENSKELNRGQKNKLRQIIMSFKDAIEAGKEIDINLNAVKHGLDIGLKQLAINNVNEKGEITITFNEKNISQKIRKGFGHFLESMSKGAAKVTGDTGLIIESSKDHFEYKITFKPKISNDGNVINARESGIETIEAFNNFLKTQENINFSYLRNFTTSTFGKIADVIKNKTTAELGKFALIDYPISIAKGTLHIEELIFGAGDYISGDMDDGEFFSRLFFFGAIPLVVLGPIIWNIVERADSGIKESTIIRITNVLKAQKQIQEKRGNELGASRIGSLLEELNSNNLEAQGDSIQGLKDPFRGKKVLYAILNKHLNNSQWSGSTIGSLGRIADQPFYRRTDKPAYEGMFKKTRTLFSWITRFYSNILFAPTKFINKGPDTKPIDFNWHKTRIFGWGIQLKDSAIMSHLEKLEIEEVRGNYIIEKLNEIPNAQIKEATSREINKLYEGFANDFSPYERTSITFKNMNSKIAKILGEATHTDISNIKATLDQFDNNYSKKIQLIEVFDKNLKPIYTDFINGHPGINDDIERQLNKKLSEIYLSSETISDFELRMSKEFEKIDTVGKVSLKDIKLQQENIGKSSLITQTIKDQYISDYKNTLARQGIDDSDITNFANKFNNFLGKDRTLSERHIAYAMIHISNGEEISKDSLLSPKEIKDFLQKINIDTTYGFFNNGPFIKNTALLHPETKNIDLGHNSEIDTNLYKTEKGKFLANWLKPESWKHTYFRNSLEEDFNKLSKQEQAIDLLLRKKMNVILTDPSNASKINDLSNEIINIKNIKGNIGDLSKIDNIDDAIVNNTNGVKIEEIINKYSKESIPDWNKIYIDIHLLDDNGLRRLASNLGITSTKRLNIFIDIFNAPGLSLKKLRIKSLGINNMLEMIYKAQ